MNGQIIKAVGGLYMVETSGGVFGCKARGIFRKQGISPCTGDLVTIEQDCIIDILPRKNMLIRPPLANLDRLFFVLSTCEPPPNLQILDKFLAVCVHKQIEPVLVFTKLDLADAEEYIEIYRAAGFRMLTVDYDRTMTAPDSTVPQRNLEAIQYFTDNGGLFTVNTGRSLPMAQILLEKIPCNAPLLLYNGSAAYDARTGKLTRYTPIDLDPTVLLPQLQKAYHRI